MKKIYPVLLAVLLLITVGVNAQVSTYTWSSLSGLTYTPLSGGTVINTTAGLSTSMTNDADDGAVLITLPFTFTFNGNGYSQVTMCSNGWVGMGNQLAVTALEGRTAGNLFSGTAPNNVIGGWFGDGSANFPAPNPGSMVHGSAGTDIYVFEWNQVTGNSFNASTTNLISYQVVIYGPNSSAPGRIETLYGPATAVPSASRTIGIGSTGTDFMNGLTGSTTSTASAAAWPGAGNGFRYTPVPCVVPTSLAASVTATPAITSVSGSFTEAAVAPSGYLVVRTSNNVQPVLVNGTNYAVGNNAVGYIEYNAAAAGNWSSIGLNSSTTYYYWVFSYGSGCFAGPVYSSASATATATTSASGNIVSTGTGGLWSSTSTWLSGTVPTQGDNVIIANGATVTIDVDAAAYSVTVGQGAPAVLDYETTTARTLAVGNNVTIAAGAAFNTAASGTVTTHTLSVRGNITNNGTLDFAIATAGTAINFIGISNSSFTGAGAVTDLYNLVLSKSARAVEVELNLSNFSVRDLSAAATGALLTSATGTGTLKFSGTNTFSGSLWNVAAYSIPATMGIWVNNPNFTVTALNGSSTVAGLFRITQGTYNIGTALGNSMGFSAGSVVSVEGGAVNATGRFGVAAAANIFSYTQTGGTVTVSTLGNASTTLASFDLGTSALSTVALSGGNIIVSLASTAASTPRDFRNQAGAGVATVTGGTLQIGDANSGAAKIFNIAGVVPNFSVSNASAGHTVNFGAPVTYNNLTLDINVTAGCTVNFGNQSFLFGGATINNNGIITHNGASSRFITFKPGSNVTYSGTGSVTAPITSLELQNDLNFIFDPAVSNVVANRVIIFSGSFVNANKITLGNGGTTSAIVQIGNTTTPTGGGTFDVAPNFNIGSGGQSISYLRTTNAKTTGPEVNPARLLNNMTFDDNVNSLTVAGGPLTVSGTLTLTTGAVNTSTANLITVGTSGTTLGTIVRTAGMVNGPLKKWYAAAIGTATLPIGTATLYKPATINFTTAPTSAGTITANFSTAIPGFPNAAPLTEGALIVNHASNQGSWFVETGDGLAGGNYTATFTGNGASDVIDYTKTVLIKRPTAGGDWTLDGTHVTSTGSNSAPVVSRTGLSGFSEFAIGGELLVALPVTIEYFRGSKQAGKNRLDWKIACYNSPSVTLTLERSSDGTNFKPISTINETAARCLQPFNYNDASPLAGVNYYRLKSTDADAVVKYSNVVALLNKEKGFELVYLAPNPVKDKALLNITTAERTIMEVVVSDLNGKQVSKQKVTLVAGNNQVQVNLAHVAAGTYQVTGLTTDGQARTLRFVKQ